MEKNCPKRARAAVARKLAVMLGRRWKDGTHFDGGLSAQAVAKAFAGGVRKWLGNEEKV